MQIPYGENSQTAAQQSKIVVALDELEKLLLELREQTGYMRGRLEQISLPERPETPSNVNVSPPVPASIAMMRIDSAKAEVRNIIALQHSILDRLDI